MENNINSRQNNKLSLRVFVFSCLFLLSAASVYHQWTRADGGAILTWDAAGYYLYLPSFFYDDLGKVTKLNYIEQNYHPGSDLFSAAVLQPNGNYIMKYSSGMAFMYLPAFAAGHIWAKLGGYKVDGFSMPYQCAINFWNLIVAFIGLWYLRKLLIKYFEDKAVAIAMLVLVIATNYFHYTALCGVLTHNYLFTVYALILYHTDKWYDQPIYWRSALLGMLCGLATLTRPTEIICVLIPVLWGIAKWKDVGERLKLFMRQFPKLFVFSVSAIAVGSIQLIYWKIYSGHWLYYSYGNQSFSWLRPHILNGMFSYKKGWFTYTPIMIFSLIGLYSLYWQKPSLFVTVTVFTLINIYITFAWDIWGYGGSFSQRAVVQSYALLMLPLTAFTHTVLKKHWYLIFIPILVFCTWLNIFMSWQAINGILDCNNMTRAYYWRSFGRSSVTAKDLKLLDTNEELPQRLEDSLTPLITYSLDKDTQAINCPIPPGGKVIQLDMTHQEFHTVKLPVGNKSHGWFRAYTKIYYPYTEWDTWKQTQFIIQLFQSGKKVKDRLIRVQRITAEKKWQDVYVDIHIPKGSAIDTINVFSYNAGGDKPIWLGNYRVYYTPDE